MGSKIILNNRSIYVVPTRFGYVLAIILLILLLNAMNYENSMAFMLTFLLTGIALLGMNYTYSNMAGLILSPAKNKSVFAGDRAILSFHAENPNGKYRYALFLGNTDEQQHPNLIDQDNDLLRYLTPPLERGIYSPKRLRIWTVYPFGLFFVWSWFKLSNSVIVYPKPLSFVGDINNGGIKPGDKQSPREGDDDFSGIRRYQETDSPNRIAWKALAHSQQLLSKSFTATVDNEIWLKYDELARLSSEERLSQLCFWVLECEKDKRHYGLDLPSQKIDVGLGESHRKKCLEALALFNIRDTQGEDNA